MILFAIIAVIDNEKCFIQIYTMYYTIYLFYKILILKVMISHLGRPR